MSVTVTAMLYIVAFPETKNTSGCTMIIIWYMGYGHPTIGIHTYWL